MITNQQATANHTAKMFNHSRTQHLTWGGNPATIGIRLPKDYILIDDYPIHAGYQHDKDGYVWMYDGNGWICNGWARQEKIKMTRKKAISNIRAAFNPGYPVESFVNALEALGLIKFDDEITEIDILKHYSDSPDAIIYNLDRGGYKIVKK